MTHPRATTLAALAELVEGKTVGDPSLTITAAHPINDATPGCITLADNPQRVKNLVGGPAAAAVVATGSDLEGLPGIEVDDVHAAFTKIALHFRPARTTAPSGVHASAVIAASAQVDPSARIDAGAIIGEESVIGARAIIHSSVVIGAGCQVGADSQLFPHVVLYDDVVIGQRCLIHSGAVLGAYGFGYTQENGRHVLSAQLGGVEVADDVDIGAAVTVDRGVYGPTRIGEGAKIDNLVQIAHNCQIGRHNIICSQVGIAGSTSTGDYVVMGGQVGVRDHVHIGSGSMLGAKAGVSNNIADGAQVLGSPAIPVREKKLQFAAVSKLPAMRKEFKQMRKLVERLQATVFGADDNHKGGRAA